MVCSGIDTLLDTSITGIMSFPTTCDYYFYAKIMGAFFIILTFILYRRDEDKGFRSEFISAMGVSSIATIFVALLGTFISIIQPDIFIKIFVVGMIFIVIWLLKK